LFPLINLSPTKPVAVWRCQARQWHLSTSHASLDPSIDSTFCKDKLHRHVSQGIEDNLPRLQTVQVRDAFADIDIPCFCSLIIDPRHAHVYHQHSLVTACGCLTTTLSPGRHPAGPTLLHASYVRYLTACLGPVLSLTAFLCPSHRVESSPSFSFPFEYLSCRSKSLPILQEKHASCSFAVKQHSLAQIVVRRLSFFPYKSVGQAIRCLW